MSDCYLRALVDTLFELWNRHEQEEVVVDDNVKNDDGNVSGKYKEEMSLMSKINKQTSENKMLTNPGCD